MKIDNRKPLREMVFNFPTMFGIISLLILIAVLVFTSIKEEEKNDNYLKKIELIKSKKYSLICSDKILRPKEYDLVRISDSDLIVDIDNFDTPAKGIDVSLCNVIEKQTNDMVKPIKPVETNETERLHIEIANLESKIHSLESTIIGNKAIINRQDRDLKDVYSFASEQNKRIEKYVLMEARYLENQELLTKLVERLNITDKNGKHYNLDDLIVEKKQEVLKIPEVPKPRKDKVLEITTIMSEKELTLKRKLFIIRALSKNVGSNKKWDKIVITMKDLETIKLQADSIKRFDEVNKSFDTAIRSLTFVLAKKTAVSPKDITSDINDILNKSK